MARPRVRLLIDVECEYCHKPLQRPLDKTRNKKERYYCSQSCYFSWKRDCMPSSEIWNYTKQGELIAELQRVANLLGHLPTRDEMEEYGKIYPSTYQKRFGSWYMALANITDPSPEAAWNVSQVSLEDGGWLSGIADGESLFRVAKQKHSYTCIWGFQLRADDIYAAEEVKRILGLAKRPLRWWDRENDRKRGIEAGDAVRFFVRDIPTHIAHTLPFFRRFPLRSKKQIEFPLFAEAVELLHNHQSQGLHKPYPESLKMRLAEIKLTLEEAKKYKHPDEVENYLADRDLSHKQFNRRRVF